MKTQMYMSSNKINLGIIGKPNSGKSTLFNSLLGDYISPVGDEYGLTKTLYKKKFLHNNNEFIIFDTPGLRRKSKVTETNELARNSEVIRLINKVEVIILLIDSIESITKQDFRLADIVIEKNKVLFIVFNKIDIIQDKKNFELYLKKYLKNNYSKNKCINLGFISAKKNTRISNVLREIILKKELISIKINKQKLNKFINYLNNKSSLPRFNKIEIKPKYIVQLENKIPKFKIFINIQKKPPQLFQKFFDNSFRSYFKLDGVPILYDFKTSKNPYIR